MTDLRRPMFAICHPGDLDGPAPFLYFDDEAVAKGVMDAMNTDEESASERYTLRQIRAWPSSDMPVRTSWFQIQAWLDRDTGVIQHAEFGGPELVESRLWPWDMAHYADQNEEAQARAVPAGIWISSCGFDRAKVRAGFEALLAGEQARISRAARVTAAGGQTKVS